MLRHMPLRYDDPARDGRRLRYPRGMPDAAAVIAALRLRAHPEGGWFAETWRAPADDGARPSSSAILYLLAAGERSHWHRVDAAEVWQFVGRRAARARGLGRGRAGGLGPPTRRRTSSRASARRPWSRPAPGRPPDRSARGRSSAASSRRRSTSLASSSPRPTGRRRSDGRRDAAGHAPPAQPHDACPPGAPRATDRQPGRRDQPPGRAPGPARELAVHRAVVPPRGPRDRGPRRRASTTARWSRRP